MDYQTLGEWQIEEIHTQCIRCEFQLPALERLMEKPKCEVEELEYLIASLERTKRFTPENMFDVKIAEGIHVKLDYEEISGILSLRLANKMEKLEELEKEWESKIDERKRLIKELGMRGIKWN